jgi:hypothetical protein
MTSYHLLAFPTIADEVRYSEYTAVAVLATAVAIGTSAYVLASTQHDAALLADAETLIEANRHQAM